MRVILKKMVAGRSVAGYGNKGRPFPLALPRADYLREFTLNFRRLITSRRFLLPQLRRE